MNARLRRLFDITGIDKIFAIHDTVDQAVAAVEESQ
jgi:anti-anti-sigma regulatory factor